MPTSGEPTIVYRAASAQQASLLRNLLEEEGIAAWVQNDLIQGAAGELPLGWVAAAQVVVRSSDAEEARRLALEFEEQMRHEADSPTADEAFDEMGDGTDDWANWPRCPSCGERRHAQCPLCGTSGAHFPLVDLDRSESGERVLLLCRDCDEPFSPRFYALCHRCGHDFGSGIRVTSALPHVESHRVWIVMAVVSVAAVLLAGYFWFVLR